MRKKKLYVGDSWLFRITDILRGNCIFFSEISSHVHYVDVMYTFESLNTSDRFEEHTANIIPWYYILSNGFSSTSAENCITICKRFFICAKNVLREFLHASYSWKTFQLDMDFDNKPAMHAPCTMLYLYFRNLLKKTLSIFRPSVIYHSVCVPCTRGTNVQPQAQSNPKSLLVNSPVSIEDGHCHPRLLIFPAPKVPHKVVCFSVFLSK